jgi:predicted hydrocarbon binding protein
MIEQPRNVSNAALRTLFLALEQVMGANGIKAMLNFNGLKRFINNYPPNNLEKQVSYVDYGEAEQAVEDFYGQRGARVFMLRIGRASFRFALEEQPAILGVAGLALKLLPPDTRMKFILTRMAHGAGETLDMPCHVEDTPEYFVYVVNDCPCRFRKRELKTPCCYVTVGELSEAMRWATGAEHCVTEYECINIGNDACRFRVEKKATEKT